MFPGRRGTLGRKTRLASEKRPGLHLGPARSPVESTSPWGERLLQQGSHTTMGPARLRSTGCASVSASCLPRLLPPASSTITWDSSGLQHTRLPSLCQPVSLSFCLISQPCPSEPRVYTEGCTGCCGFRSKAHTPRAPARPASLPTRRMIRRPLQDERWTRRKA